MAPCTHPGTKKLFFPKGKKLPRSIRSLGLASLPRGLFAWREKTSSILVDRYMRQSCLVPAEAGCVRREEKEKTHEIPPNTKNHTTKYIHSSPATATTSRRRAVKHAPLGSPYWHSSSIDPGFLEIRVACIHAYVRLYTCVCIYWPFCCCCCAAWVRFGALYDFMANAASSFSAVILVYISGFGVVRWCLTLSFRRRPLLLPLTAEQREGACAHPGRYYVRKTHILAVAVIVLLWNIGWIHHAICAVRTCKTATV